MRQQKKSPVFFVWLFLLWNVVFIFAIVHQNLSSHRIFFRHHLCFFHLRRWFQFRPISRMADVEERWGRIHLWDHVKVQSSMRIKTWLGISTYLSHNGIFCFVKFSWKSYQLKPSNCYNLLSCYCQQIVIIWCSVISTYFSCDYNHCL